MCLYAPGISHRRCPPSRSPAPSPLPSFTTDPRDRRSVAGSPSGYPHLRWHVPASGSQPTQPVSPDHLAMSLLCTSKLTDQPCTTPGAFLLDEPCSANSIKTQASGQVQAQCSFMICFVPSVQTDAQFREFVNRSKKESTKPIKIDQRIQQLLSMSTVQNAAKPGTSGTQDCRGASACSKSVPADRDVSESSRNQPETDGTESCAAQSASDCTPQEEKSPLKLRKS